MSGNPVNFVDPTGEFANIIIGGIIGGGLDLGLQLWDNGGRFECVDWGSVGTSAALGVVGGLGLIKAGGRLLGPRGPLFGNPYYSYGKGAGYFNKGINRTGWSRYKKKVHFEKRGAGKHDKSKAYFTIGTNKGKGSWWW